MKEITVVKRDGKKVEFNVMKINDAIRKAFKATGINHPRTMGISMDISKRVYDNITKKNMCLVDVEYIQDLVETFLMEVDKDTARNYIKYRQKRNIRRNIDSYKDFETIINVENNDITKENANMNAETPSGMMMKFASETTKKFTDDVLIKDEYKQAVDDNIMHIHDKDFYPTKSFTCLQHPMDRILYDGFKAGHASSRGCKRIESAVAMVAMSLQTIQNEMHGGQAIPNIDFYLAPFVRKTYIEEIKDLEIKDNKDYDYLYNIIFDDYEYLNPNKFTGDSRTIQLAVNNTVKRVKQAMESFIHNMNTMHSRGGNQVVFSSINYGTDTSAEGRLVIRALLETTYEGVGDNETAIFPIQIFKVKSGVSYEKTDINYDLYKLACKVTAKRFFPNFLNLDATFNTHEKWDINDPERYIYEPDTMGCRTRVFENLHGEKTSVGRGNLSFTTLNLPRLAMIAKKNNPENPEEEFMRLLGIYCELGINQLKDRYDFQKTALKQQFPLLMNGMWNGSENLKYGDSVEEVIKQGTLGLGFIGLAEALIVLTGKHHAESEYSQNLGLKIVDFMNEKVNEAKKEYNLNYSVLATPAEGLSGKFTKKDREEFGIIKHVTDKDYYTNSNHVPVWYKCSAKHKASIEGPYHEKTLGGHIFYIEFDGDATKNEKAIMQAVDVMRANNIGYGSINHNRNRCLDCGFENSKEGLTVCPKCGSQDIDTIARITGYLVGGKNRWNSGKKAEWADRVKHN